MDQDKLAAARAKWRDKVAKTSERFPERQSPFKSTSGYEIERLYEPTAPDPDYGDKLGFPGTYPFTRGVQPTMYRSMFWTMRQYSGFGDAASTNERFHFLTEGETAHRLSTAFDSVTLYGRDPARRPDIYGKVGNSGVSVATLRNWEQGRRMPEGPARALLRVAAHNPQAVRDALNTEEAA